MSEVVVEHGKLSTLWLGIVKFGHLFQPNELGFIKSQTFKNFSFLILVAVFLSKIFFFIWSPLVRRNLFWPPSMVISKGEFPSRWKEGIVTPVFKKGDKTYYYISVIISHILHITNHAVPSVWVAIHVLHSGHFFSWDMGAPHFLFIQN